MHLIQPVRAVLGLSQWYEGSLLKEILDYINQKWFTVELHAYNYIPINERTAGTLRTLILGLALGIILAAATSFCTKRSAGRLVAALLKEQALSKEKGRTLMELGLFRSASLRRDLRRGTVLRKYVKCVEEQATDAPESFRMDFASMHFYVPEELKYTAETRYDLRGSGWSSLLLAVLLTVLLAALTCVFLPDLLSFADWLIGMTAPR